MFSAKPKTPRPTGCCAQQMKRFHSMTAGQPFDTNPVRGAAAPLTTPRKGFFDSLGSSLLFGRLGVLFLPPDAGGQGIPQGFQIDGLGYVGVHTGFQRVLHIPHKGVDRHGDARNGARIRVTGRANALGGDKLFQSYLSFSATS